MTTIYIVRHSEPFKSHRGIEDVNESLLQSNIKSPLSINGEKLAEKISASDEFDNIDVVWSSNYVRCMSTAKYFAARNNLKVNVSEKLGERKHGIESWKDLPENFEQLQFKDENYKIGYGESQKEVRQRLVNFVNKLLINYKDKRILIVSHSTATAYLLGNWSKISYDGPYIYKNKNYFEGIWNYCETFKLTFDDQNNLVDIKNLKF